MGNGIRGLLTILLFSTLGACGQLAVNDNCECGFYTKASDGSILAWSDGAKLTFDVAPDMPNDFKPAVVATGSTYNSLLSKTQISVRTTNTRAKAFGGSTSDLSGDGVNGVYWVSGEWPWAKSNPKSAAMTLVLFDGDHIKEADVYFRASSFPKYNASAALSNSTFDPEKATGDLPAFYAVSLHEFGHAVGRVHSTDRSSLMYPTVGESFAFTPFAAYDVEKFEPVYTVNKRSSYGPMM